MHDSADEIIDPLGLRYSTDLHAYAALCFTCHRALDVCVARYGQEQARIKRLRNLRRVDACPELSAMRLPDGFGGSDALAILADQCEESQATASRFYFRHYKNMCRELELRPLGYVTFMRRIVDEFDYVKDVHNGATRLTAPWHEDSVNTYDQTADMTAHVADLRAAGSHWIADLIEATYSR